MMAGFRNQMLDAVRGFSGARQNGLFINSCFAHCQSERQDTWYAGDSPRLGNKVRKLCGDAMKNILASKDFLTV
jgi:hypothetical protein